MKSKAESSWQVYMIQTESGKLYTGITTDLEKRFNSHAKRRGGASFFHFSIPKEIVYREHHPDRSSASKREAAIKAMTRQQKLKLAGIVL